MNVYIDKEINNIRDKYDYGYNLNRLLYLYTEMTDNNEEIEIIYKLEIDENKDKDDEDYEELNSRIRIFGSTFIANNKQKCKIVYNNEEYELKEYFNDIDEIYVFWM